MAQSHDDVVSAHLIDLQDNGNNFTGKIKGQINFDKFMNDIRSVGYSYVTADSQCNRDPGKNRGIAVLIHFDIGLIADASISKFVQHYLYILFSFQLSSFRLGRHQLHSAEFKISFFGPLFQIKQHTYSDCCQGKNRHEPKKRQNHTTCFVSRPVFFSGLFMTVHVSRLVFSCIR